MIPSYEDDSNVEDLNMDMSYPGGGDMSVTNNAGENVRIGVRDITYDGNYEMEDASQQGSGPIKSGRSSPKRRTSIRRLSSLFRGRKRQQESKATE